MIIGSILLLIAILELLMGLRFLFGYQRSLSTQFYGLFSLSIALYVGANAFGYLGVTISGQTAEHLAWAGGALGTIFYLPFTYSFPVPRRTFQELFPWILWPLAVFVPGILFSDYFIQQQGIVRFGYGYVTETGPLFWFFLLFFGLYWIWSIRNLIVRLRQSDGIHRWQLRLILIGLLTSLLVTVVFDVVMPLTSATRFGYVGSLFTSVWLGFTGYIILKR